MNRSPSELPAVPPVSMLVALTRAFIRVDRNIHDKAVEAMFMAAREGNWQVVFQVPTFKMKEFDRSLDALQMAGFRLTQRGGSGADFGEVIISWMP